MPACRVSLARGANLAAVALFVLLVFQAGCAPVQPRYADTAFATQPPPADKARIIFLRPDDFYLGAEWARLAIDAAIVGRLARGQFLVADIAPGEHEIAVDEENSKGRFAFKMNFDAGLIYDIQVSQREDNKTYQATGGFAAIIKLFGPPADDQNPFLLQPVLPWEVLRTLRRLELAE